MHDQGVGTLLAFDNPWQIAALIGLAVSLRLWAAYSRAFTTSPIMRTARGYVLEFLDSALIALLLVFCILRPFVIQAFFIPSGSMLPTLQLNDRILVNKLVYHFRDPEPGDIVVFRAPPAASIRQQDFIKRVVGTPGDRLQVRRFEGLYRNGKLINEPYIRETPAYDWPRHGASGLSVPEDNIVVFGDNRNNSNDSHAWQAIAPDLQQVENRPFVPRQNVLGKAMVIFWPPTRMRVVH
jgi:signal peptidase I